MCHHEVVGDFYRGCGHFHGRYFTGEMRDCGSFECKTSAMHKHKTTRHCNCPEVVTEERKIQNLFQVPYVECQRTTR